MGTVMVTTDIAVDAAIITVGAEGAVIITDGTEAVVTVTGRARGAFSSPLVVNGTRQGLMTGASDLRTRTPTSAPERRCQGFAPLLSSKIHKPAAGLA